MTATARKVAARQPRVIGQAAVIIACAAGCTSFLNVDEVDPPLAPSPFDFADVLSTSAPAMPERCAVMGPPPPSPNEAVDRKALQTVLVSALPPGSVLLSVHPAPEENEVAAWVIETDPESYRYVDDVQAAVSRHMTPDALAPNRFRLLVEVATDGVSLRTGRSVTCVPKVANQRRFHRRMREAAGEGNPPGPATVRLLIDELGFPGGVELIQGSSSESWNAASIRIASTTRFLPGVVDRKPMEMRTQMLMSVD